MIKKKRTLEFIGCEVVFDLNAVIDNLGNC